VGTRKLLHLLKPFGAAAKPFSQNFASLLSSFRDTGGLERLMDFIFLGANAANGYDSLGHFLRTEGVATVCLKYQIKLDPKCNRKLANTGTTATKASAGDGEEAGLVMKRTYAVIKGATPAQAIARYPGPTPTPAEIVGGVPSVAPSSAKSGQPVGGSTSGTTYYSPSGGTEAGGLLLNYLLGN
jgi:hypothetical protein